VDRLERNSDFFEYYLPIIILLYFLLWCLPVQSQVHPYIIVKESEYLELQSNATKWPWSMMKSRALATASNLEYDSGESFSEKCKTAQSMAGACALAYILEDQKKADYINKIETDFALLMDDIRTGKQSGDYDHRHNVPPASAAFMAYLVLDIMYADLSNDIRLLIEDDCDYIAGNHKNSWLESKYAIEGMMALYHDGVTSLFVEKKDAYKNHILIQTTVNLVFSKRQAYTKSR